MIESYKKQFAEILSKELPLLQEEIIWLIEIPPENIPGDLAFPCFQLSKTMKKSPNIIAQETVNQLSSLISQPAFVSFEAIGWYINAHINTQNFIASYFSDHATPQHKSEKVLIEYMNANPNKALHIWQARNICIGDSMRRIYKYLWYQVHTTNYGDDSWVNVWYNIVWHLYYWYPIETDIKYDHYCGKIYEEMRKHSEEEVFKQQLSTVLQKIESADPEIHNLHKTYTQKCTEQQIHSCWKLGASFDLIVRETDILHRNFFSKTMEILKNKWHVKFAEEWEAKWCWIIDLSSLPEYANEEKQYQILIKSDWVASYMGKDISFAMRKLWNLQDNFEYQIFTKEPNWNIIYTSTSEIPQEETHQFGDYNKAITVIDNRQIPAQTIVQSALKLLGVLTEQKQYSPLGYGVVYLTSQTLTKLWYTLSEEEKSEKRLAFSSRKWRTVMIDEMLEILQKKAYDETKERNPDKDEIRLKNTAEKIAIWSLRFFLIKWDISKDIVFDIDEVLNMEWETWAYVLYTWARIQSIIDQSQETINNADLWLLTEKDEFTLIKKMSEFEWIIINAKDELAPHFISKYLFELSVLINSYYAHVKILKSEENIKKARIFLLQKTQEIVKTGMDLIGMQFIERM